MSRHLEKSQKHEKFGKVIGILKLNKISVLGIRLVKLKHISRVNINPARVLIWMLSIGLIISTLHLKS